LIPHCLFLTFFSFEIFDKLFLLILWNFIMMHLDMYLFFLVLPRSSVTMLVVRQHTLILCMYVCDWRLN
jgi:hypothetical protein